MKVEVVSTVRELMATTMEQLCAADCVITSLDFLKRDYLDMYLAGFVVGNACNKCGGGRANQHCTRIWHQSDWGPSAVLNFYPVDSPQFDTSNKPLVEVRSHMCLSPGVLRRSI